LIYTWNPKLETDAVHKKFVIDEPPPDSWVQKVNWRDNPWFPEVLRAEMEQCKRTNPVKYDWIWEGEVLRAAIDALWTFESIDAQRVTIIQADLAPTVRKVVAVDPAVTANKKSDETGIVITSCTHTRPRHYYVHADLSGKYSPDGWARVVLDAYDHHEADAIVFETNQGGDLVLDNIRNACRALKREIPKLIGVRASKGKALRAEPIAGLYEQKLCHHAGHFPDLERQMLRYDPLDPTQKSPDRLDALVWALTELSSGRQPMKIAESALAVLTARRR
jgi:phage terminase large subunit-like protein